MRVRIVAAIVAAGCLTGTSAVAQQPGAPDLFRAAPDTYAPRYEPGREPGPSPYPVGPGTVIDEPSRRAAPASRPPQGAVQSRGHLSLIVEPVTAQIYVDGFFVGAVDDYRGTPGPLIETGLHRIELRAEGYETAAVEVRIAAGQVVTHRRILARAGSPVSSSPLPNPPAAGAASRVFYVIPRCYAGDTPPRPAHLPAGCDIANLRAVMPVEPAAGGQP